MPRLRLIAHAQSRDTNLKRCEQRRSTPRDTATQSPPYLVPEDYCLDCLTPAPAPPSVPTCRSTPLRRCRIRQVTALTIACSAPPIQRPAWLTQTRLRHAHPQSRCGETL